jgi:UPF0716 family protein affecting phage T7 exclusion
VNYKPRLGLLLLLAAATLFARVQGFGEYRAVQESLRTGYPNVGGRNAD